MCVSAAAAAIGGICTPKSSIVHHLFTDWTDLWCAAVEKKNRLTQTITTHFV